jgi:hypothetical protein
MQKSQEMPQRAEILLRKEDSTSNKIALKEKFVVVYEAFFKGEDPSEGNPNFWDEVLLLKVNFSFLERCIILTSEDQLVALKDNIKKIFFNCMKGISDANIYRSAHALETLAVLMRSIFRKKFNNFGYDVMNILCGIDVADTAFQELLRSVRNVLMGSDVPLKESALNLLVIIITAVENINQNTLFEYFMITDLFDTFMQIVKDSSSPTDMAFNVILILMTLANYQKYESQNPYLKHLAELDDVDILRAFASVIAVVCMQLNKQYSLVMTQPAGVFSRLTGFFSGFISTSRGGSQQEDPSITSPSSSPPGASMIGAFLLTFYELVHLNPHFMKAALGATNTNIDTSDHNNSSPQNSPRRVDTYEPGRGHILQHFLTFCSYLFVDLKDTRSLTYTKLCLLTLICLTECNDVNNALHDPTIISVPVSPSPISASGPVSGTADNKEQWALACVVLDVLNAFMKQNLKKFQTVGVDLYMRAVGCVHRVLSYEKRTGTRLTYRWKDMWNTLLMIIKHVTSDTALHTPDALSLCMQVITVFNLFITYGDTFLPSPSDYDDLYYELMRVSKMLDQFYSIVERNDPAGHMTINLLNIKTIISHFSAKIEQWTHANPEVTLTPDRVLKVIKDNYDSLKLKLQENLDHYENYIEYPKEVAFFRQLIRTLVSDIKATLNVVHTKLPNVT